MDEHERSVKNAEKAGDELAILFASIGSVSRPTGELFTSYRNARRALRAAIADAVAARSIMTTLVEDVRRIVETILRRAADIGDAQSRVDADVWGLNFTPSFLDSNVLAESVDAITLQTESQRAQVLAAVRAGSATAPQLLGANGSLGMVTPAPIALGLTRAAVSTHAYAYHESVTQSIENTPGRMVGQYVRQAVAAIDAKTTDCCLRVHGQTAPIDGMFTLTGTPKFADRLAYPPFHWRCRTATALVFKSLENDSLTQRMIASAKAERAARDAGGSTQGRYTNAFSGGGRT
jgi:hypothetical protein